MTKAKTFERLMAEAGKSVSLSNANYQTSQMNTGPTWTKRRLSQEEAITPKVT